MIKLHSGIVLYMVVGILTACLADTYQDGKNSLKNQFYTKAVVLFEQACNEGNAKGCFELGALYEKGNGVGQNKYQAVSLYTQACGGGDTYGCSNMAMMYDTP